jgi:predicted helicase
MITLRPHQQRIVNRMSKSIKGQVIVPTGGGKTLCMIHDAQRQFAEGNQTIVVVAPRILLAQQLSSEFLEIIDNVEVLHVHSGETDHYSTTKPQFIGDWFFNNQLYGHNGIIFTTYHSLNRIQQSGIPVNTVYFDEAHNSVQRHFYSSTKFFATTNNRRCFFFTATPHHHSSNERGMNNAEVYGRVIEQVPAPELVDAGYILPPKVVVNQCEMIRDRKITCEDDADNILSSIDSNSVDKILICARRTSQIVRLFADSKLGTELYGRGYNWMYITAKTGAVINGVKVSRVKFFETLNTWGKDNTRFVVLHHSILSEGINVNGLEAVLFLRSMNYTTISQTIGRVIRKGNVNKQFGIVSIPVYDKVGISTSRKVDAVVNTIFEKGEPAISISRR